MVRPLPLGLLCLAPFALTPALAAQDQVVLFQPFAGSTTYLVDEAGTVVNSWPGVTTPALAVYLLADGDLMRTQMLVGGLAGSGGGLERVSQGGLVEWQFQFFGPAFYPHHDIEVLPNGNVLMIVYELLTGQDAIDLGRDPSLVTGSFTPDSIYEIEPQGLTGGNVVWEWHATDHVVQDFDSGKPNFGVVADFPERININYPPTPLATSGDWLHLNGIDYNAELDQIAISTPFFSEIWILDHSTTTAEAAGSTGGNSGKGGDLLYRWGNPVTYDRGTTLDRKLFTNHDIQWVEPGRPGAGNLIVFNNGVARPTGNYSSVDEWAPPVDVQGNYSIAPGQPFGPAALTWTYEDPGNFYSNIMGGCERLPDGNTLVCEATSGRMFEVDPAGSVVWSYVNPFGGLNWVFKARKYPACTAPVVSYCTAGSSASGCQAALSASGSPSASAASGFVVSAAGVEGGKNGLFFFGTNGRQANPWGNGSSYQCVAPPVSRAGLLSASGSVGACDGSFSQDLAARWAAGPSKRPELGSVGQVQLWFRDPASTSNQSTSLSDALEFMVCP